MRLTRIFVSAALAPDTEQLLPRSASDHLLKVLRLRPGAELTLFDGRGGEYAARLISAARGAARIAVGEQSPIERESPLAVTLLQGLARGERMDLIVQKATELGARAIVPLLTERSVVRLDASQTAKRLAHWQAIAIGACEQCGRNRLPQIGPLTELSRVGELQLAGARLVLEPNGRETLPGAIAGCTEVALLIGPEGGLSDAEVEAALDDDFVPCRLGPRVLRAETAPLAALAALQLLAGDLGR
ncbi:MAG TPA: 16S rRNA (uracil(1498)-N(3))-methyltransferase [Steroidobacteraceae bacterium]